MLTHVNALPSLIESRANVDHPDLRGVALHLRWLKPRGSSTEPRVSIIIGKWYTRRGKINYRTLVGGTAILERIGTKSGNRFGRIQMYSKILDPFLPVCLQYVVLYSACSLDNDGETTISVQVAHTVHYYILHD